LNNAKARHSVHSLPASRIPDTLSVLFALCVIAATAVASPATLEGTYWRLQEMSGQPVSPGSAATLPHIALHHGTSRVAGFGGCNRFFGQYSLSGNDITITPMGGSRGSCGDADELERTFIRTLASATRFRIDGSHLVLILDGTPLLVFEAVAG